MNEEQRKLHEKLTCAIATQIIITVGGHTFTVQSTVANSKTPDKMQAVVFTDKQCEEIGRQLAEHIPIVASKILGFTNIKEYELIELEDNDG